VCGQICSNKLRPCNVQHLSFEEEAIQVQWNVSAARCRENPELQLLDCLYCHKQTDTQCYNSNFSVSAHLVIGISPLLDLRNQANDRSLIVMTCRLLSNVFSILLLRNCISLYCTVIVLLSLHFTVCTLAYVATAHNCGRQ